MFGRMKLAKADSRDSNNSICSDQCGVSDVVGTIMMVAITVIMSVVIASAIFSLSPPPDIPHTDIEFRANGSTIDIYHMGGEPIKVEDMKFMADGQEVFLNSSSPVNESEEWNIGTLIILDTNNTGLKIVHLPSQELLI
ncbi:type IV pilin N-terminal domain-containing protein [Methanococcoides sp. SA1]|nr:type IV pilin N-terminal domain-containing protein [Methanococcoides sp. SA1]